MTTEEKIDKALHIDWAFDKSKPTRIIVDGSMTKGAYHTSYSEFVKNISALIKAEVIESKIDLLEEIVDRYTPYRPMLDSGPYKDLRKYLHGVINKLIDELKED